MRHTARTVVEEPHTIEGHHRGALASGADSGLCAPQSATSAHPWRTFYKSVPNLLI